MGASGTRGVGAGEGTINRTRDVPAASDASGAGSNSGVGRAGDAVGSSGADAGIGASAGSPVADGANGGTAPTGETGCPTNLLFNGGFEAGAEPWVSYTTGQDPLIYDATAGTYDGVDPHGGSRLGWLGGVPSEINRLSQTLTIPANATRLALEYSIRIQISEVHANVDVLRIRLIVAGQATLVAQFTNADASDAWVDLTPPAIGVTTGGQSVAAILELESEIGAGPGTNFYLDDLALVPTCAPP